MKSRFAGEGAGDVKSVPICTIAIRNSTSTDQRSKPKCTVLHVFGRRSCIWATFGIEGSHIPHF